MVMMYGRKRVVFRERVLLINWVWVAFTWSQLFGALLYSICYMHIVVEVVYYIMHNFVEFVG